MDHSNIYRSDEITAYVTEVIAPRNISVTSRHDRLIKRIQCTNQGATLWGTIFVWVFVIFFSKLDLESLKSASHLALTRAKRSIPQPTAIRSHQLKSPNLTKSADANSVEYFFQNSWVNNDLFFCSPFEAQGLRYSQLSLSVTTVRERANQRPKRTLCKEPTNPTFWKR